MNQPASVMTSNQDPWIFLSYRRGKSGHWAAARISSELEAYCGKNSVFYDAGSLQAGVEWDTVILNALARCCVLIVLIEEDWPVAKLHEPQDWVSREIQAALQQRKPVIPLCIDGATVPKADSLPSEIRDLTRRQGYFVDSRTEQIFKASMSVISDELRKTFPSEIVLVREREWWWDRMARNEWSFLEKDKLLLKLERDATSESATVDPGIHHLAVRWAERELDKPRSNGRTSYGETAMLEVALWPGRYTYTLNSEEDTRSWWRRFFGTFGNEDKCPRTLTLISYQPKC